MDNIFALIQRLPKIAQVDVLAADGRALRWRSGRVIARIHPDDKRKPPLVSLLTRIIQSKKTRQIRKHCPVALFPTIYAPAIMMSDFFVSNASDLKLQCYVVWSIGYAYLAELNVYTRYTNVLVKGCKFIRPAFENVAYDWRHPGYYLDNYAHWNNCDQIGWFFADRECKSDAILAVVRKLANK